MKTSLQQITLTFDSEWKVVRRYACGHMQHACCEDHLDEVCPIC